MPVFDRREPSRSSGVWLGCMLVLTASTRLVAQPDPREPAQPVAGEPAPTLLAGQIEVTRLVDVAAGRLGVNVEYDAAALRAAGSITLRADAGLSDAELWSLMNRVLAMRGFTTVRVDGASRSGAPGGPARPQDAPRPAEVRPPGEPADPGRDGAFDAPRRPSYAVVKTTDALAVVVLPEVALQREFAPGSTPAGRPLTAAGSGVAPPAGFETVVVRAMHRPAKELADALGRVLARGAGGGTASGAIALDEGGGLLLLSDLASRLDQSLAMLALLDVPAGATDVIEVPVRNLTAPALATLVAQVAAKRELVAREKVPGEVLASPAGNAVLVVAPADRVAYWRDLVERLDRRERVETVTYAPRSFSPREVADLVEQTIKDPPGVPTDDRWRVVADELTGTLVITATPSQHESIRALVERLDATPAAARRPARSFAIRNRPVAEVRAILEDMAGAGLIGDVTTDSGPPGSSSGPSGGASPWPPAEARPAGTPPASATPTSGPTSVATPSAQRPVAGHMPSSPARAGGWDAQRGPRDDSPLRLTTDDGTNTLIVMADPRTLAQVEALLPTLDVRQPQVMLEVLLVSLSDSQKTDLGVELDKLTLNGNTSFRLSSLFGLSGRSGAGEPLVGNGAGLTGLVLSPGDFSIVVRALQTINRGRSLSMPRLLVANNQQATLNSTLDQPYASTNASNTVTTTSFGGSQQAGTQISLKPQIVGGWSAARSEGDAEAGHGSAGVRLGEHLNLEYSISLSSFVGAAASANLPPPRQENRVQSSASLPDGYTVVVGGIDLDTDGKGTSQVPGLGSIPILGEAFKSRSSTTSRTRFYVFIRATVMRADGYEDLKYASDAATAEAGVDDGWPVLRPRVIR